MWSISSSLDVKNSIPKSSAVIEIWAIGHHEARGRAERRESQDGTINAVVTTGQVYCQNKSTVVIEGGMAVHQCS